MLNPLCVYQKFSHDIEKVKLIFMPIQRCQTTSKESKVVLKNPAEGKKYKILYNRPLELLYIIYYK